MIYVFLGGNDLTYGATVSGIYDQICNFINSLKSDIGPKYGAVLIEPEKRVKPRFITKESYDAMRNALVKKIKRKRELHYVSLNILGIKNPSGFLKNDGVHLNGAGVALVSKNLIKFARHMFSKTD